MRILLTGGTGFIGSHLIKYYLAQGAELTVVSRTARMNKDTGLRYMTWSQLSTAYKSLEGLDAIIHIAGESINQRWSDAAKARILNSRLESTRQIAALVERLEHKPKVVINGSGMSIYGSSEVDTFTEESPARITDYLAQVVEAWEAAADQIKDTRVVKLRIGIVLGMDGGAFPKMIMPYRLMVGGKIGNGSQWFSWIHIEDMIRIVDYCIIHPKLSGPVNCTAPNPVTNDRFGHLVGKVMQRPHWLPVPAIVFKLLFGEMSMLLLQGQKVVPKKLQAAGFVFRYPHLEGALRELLG